MTISNPVTALQRFGQSVWLDDLRLRASLEEDLEHAQRVIDTLERLNISLADVTDKLLDDGVALFSSAFERLLASVQQAIRTPGEMQSLH
jgi:hypothetical protein